MIIERVLFFIFLPLLSGGIGFLLFKTWISRRYEIFFNIDWDMIGPGKRAKLLKWITFIDKIFCTFIVFIFPVMHFLKLNMPLMILIYIGLCMLTVFSIYGIILKNY